MLPARGPPALPGLPGQLPAAPARRRDSSGSSGSYHTAPGSPEPPDVGPDAEDQEHWPWVAPRPGAGVQPRLSVSAQNSRQQRGSGSGFPRGPDSGPQPPPPQLRVLPSGEMEVIFRAGPLPSRAGPQDRSREAPQLRAPAVGGPSAPGPPRPPAPDGGARWATRLELRPRGASPAASAQFECVEVALEERSAPARPRTVPKRQIELRPRPQSPPWAAGAPRPRLLQRTGSLDESLGRLQAAAGLVQTALARKLGAATAAPSSAALKLLERPGPPTREAALEEARARPSRAQDSSARTRALRPWPSLRERAIRRDKPAPGSEPLGPVSSSIFLQSEEKIQEPHNHEPKARSPRGTPDRAWPGARSPPSEPSAPWKAPSRAVRPRSPSPPWQAPEGAERGPHRPASQDLPPWGRAGWRVSSPCLPEASSTWDQRSPAAEDAEDGRSPSPPTLGQRDRGVVARARSPSPESPALRAAPHAAAHNAAGRVSSPSPPASLPWEAPGSPSPGDARGPAAQGACAALRREAVNGEAPEVAPPSPPGTPETPGAQGAPTGLPLPGCGPPPGTGRRDPPRGHLGTADVDARPEAGGAGAAPGRRRMATPRPRDVRSVVKTTYAPSFPAGGPGPRPPAAPHYTSVLLKDILPAAPRPGPPPPDGAARRRAQNSTAKPFARAEIRLPPRGGAPGPGGEAARASPQPPPSGPAARPGPGPAGAATPETPRAPPEPAPPPREPRAASAPPAGPAAPQGPRRPAGAAPPGRVLVDPESGRYYWVEAPRQPRLRLLFDPESGQYVEVLLPPSPPGPPRHAYAPLALGPGLYPPAYGLVPGLSLPPSPGGAQLPWASEAGPLDGMYCLPVSGTPGPAASPLLLCTPPPSSGPAQPPQGPALPL